VLDQVPDREDHDQRSAEGDVGGHQGDTVFGHVVGDQGADHTQQDDRQPVDAGDVLLRAELGNQGRDQERTGDVGGVGETEADLFVQVVGEGLSDRGAEDLDHPEVEGHLRDLVQHLSGPPLA
jgi:hypothetical protein